jgi:hypothetical protein
MSRPPAILLADLCWEDPRWPQLWARLTRPVASPSSEETTQNEAARVEKTRAADAVASSDDDKGETHAPSVAL